MCMTWFCDTVAVGIDGICDTKKEGRVGVGDLPDFMLISKREKDYFDFITMMTQPVI